MIHRPHHVAVLAVLAAALPVTAAQAQYYGAAPPPLYPYVVQNSNGVQTGQPYAVQIAPNTYVIERPAAPRNYPYVRNVRRANPAPTARRFDRAHKPVDHALVEELRKRVPAKQEQAARDTNNGAVVNTTRIVRDPPVVVETQRVVDDPPRIIERQHIVDDEPTGSGSQPLIIENGNGGQRSGRDSDSGKKRVIEADAEVTILGPDRMSIRLFRRGHNAKASARAN